MCKSLHTKYNCKYVCVIIHIFVCYCAGTDCDDAVESYVKEGKDVNMSLETIEFVERLLQSKSKEIEKNLKLHPYYFQVPFTQIDETYRHLLRLKFRRQHLLKVVQILLYSK